MLLSLHVRNLALVEEADIEFGPGFNVITGETGAGKSVIMGAVSLLLGGRADKSMVRTGTKKCEISAEFSLTEQNLSPIRELLESNDLISEETPDALIVRRVISESAGRNYINGFPVNLPILKKLGELMIDVHAANENQSLLDPELQLAILDRYAGHIELLQNTEQAWRNWRQLVAEQQEFLSGLPSEEEAERLRKDAAFIDKAEVLPDEDIVLTERHDRAANSRDIVEIASQVSSGLTESDRSIFQELADLRRILRGLERVDGAKAEEFLSRMEDLSDSVSGLSSDLADYAADVDLDESEFQAMEERMRLLQTLKRRYGPELSDVIRTRNELQLRLDDFDDAARRREEYDQKNIQLKQIYLDAAQKLGDSRKKQASLLAPILSRETVKLGFLDARFQFDFEEGEAGPNGIDRVKLLFSANPGEPLKELSHVASSGEISRVMLAAKTVLADADAIPILVFDEIDANIGGETAVKVGEELLKLGSSKQIICISHLPRVAAFAQNHFLVNKHSDGQRTLSTICRLDRAERLAELARMLGGGDAAFRHADSILTHPGKEFDHDDAAAVQS